MAETTYMQSRIWLEEPEPNNEFACRAAYCHGYDVYGEMLGNSGWVDMLYLLFKGEAPARAQAAALEILAVALANPGPRDASVNAAMCAGVGGSPAASALMAALAVGAGGAGGAREVFRAMQAWATCDKLVEAWQGYFMQQARHEAAAPLEVWPAAEHPPGFDPLGVEASTPVKQVLALLTSALDADSRCAWPTSAFPSTPVRTWRKRPPTSSCSKKACSSSNGAWRRVAARSGISSNTSAWRSARTSATCAACW